MAILRATRAKTYPNTPAGLTRQQRDIENADMTRRGHDMQWRQGHGQRWMRGLPGWTGQCRRCGDVVIVADATGTTVWTYHGDHEGNRAGPRKCRHRRGR